MMQDHILHLDLLDCYKFKIKTRLESIAEWIPADNLPKSYILMLFSKLTTLKGVFRVEEELLRQLLQLCIALVIS